VDCDSSGDGHTRSTKNSVYGFYFASCINIIFNELINRNELPAQMTST